MKAAYPYKRCTKALKIVSMIVVLWGVCYHVSGHLACDHLFNNRLVYAQEVAEAPSLIKAIEVIKLNGLKIIATDASSKKPIKEGGFSEPVAIIMGEEGDGVSRDLLAMAD